jgi:hypothetical protein
LEDESELTNDKCSWQCIRSGHWPRGSVGSCETAEERLRRIEPRSKDNPLTCVKRRWMMTIQIVRPFEPGRNIQQEREGATTKSQAYPSTTTKRSSCSYQYLLSSQGPNRPSACEFPLLVPLVPSFRSKFAHPQTRVFHLSGLCLTFCLSLSRGLFLGNHRFREATLLFVKGWHSLWVSSSSTVPPSVSMYSPCCGAIAVSLPTGRQSV